MPNLDGTGPTGLGPKTGRGLGPCNQGKSYVQRPAWSLTSLKAKDLKAKIKRLEDELKQLKEKKEKINSDLK